MTLPPKVQGAWDNIPERGINYVTTVNSQMTEEQEKKAIAAYYATVSFMDAQVGRVLQALREEGLEEKDRKSTRLNSSHVAISYAVFCLKKKNKTNNNTT